MKSLMVLWNMVHWIFMDSFLDMAVLLSCFLVDQ